MLKLVLKDESESYVSWFYNYFSSSEPETKNVDSKDDEKIELDASSLTEKYKFQHFTTHLMPLTTEKMYFLSDMDDSDLGLKVISINQSSLIKQLKSQMELKAMIGDLPKIDIHKKDTVQAAVENSIVG